MAKKLNFYYDNKGDILDISMGKPKKAISKEIDDDVFIRLNEKNEIVGFMILNFEKRFSTKKNLSFPIEATFKVDENLASA